MKGADEAAAAASRGVMWRDLVALSRTEMVRELMLPLPWLGGSLLAAQWCCYPLALPFSFVFFLTGLRVVHGGCHHALGLSRRATDSVLVIFSVAMLGSMHAVQWNHLRHHRHCLAADDIEAMGARRSAWGAILLGPLFPYRLHAAALAAAGRRQRRLIIAELAGNLAMILLILAVCPCRALHYHLLAMAAGQCLTAFFAVWTVHHDCVEGVPPGRTIRRKLGSAITFNMFFHLEHHLFPQVPTAHLPMLARRLDAAAPEARWSLVW